VCSQGSCSGVIEGCDWTGRDFPYQLNSDISVGGVAVDENCNLYVAMQLSNASSGGVVYSIDYQTQQVLQIAELARLARGVAYNSEDATLYVTALDRLMAMNTDGSNLRELPESVAGQYLNGIALAPTEFGQYAGNLIVAQSSGNLLAFDPSDPVPVTLATIGPFVSDVVFSGTRLFVAAFTASQVQEVNAEGMLSVVAELPCEPEGLAADETGERLFVGCGRDDSLYSVSLSDGQPTLLPTAVDFNPGWAPLGMLHDNGALLVIEEATGLRVLFP
jgi:DNA-binding beta-propeller fold protein YncE